ncbi:uncharacterized protein B0P05DRAFT_522029 [Gilbertella persicaria]|uniref:uncharacterized protein n=1 Tax=Gilbertella persicaria TaxID=101096 RepID=UPI00221EBA4D|nr:uncharacterized protein B0P05DRAFT_522029 [Gilbertella persicaria]KAI8097793.1 hypothetical protein B0P05DRAFT_522029 [Gilbertella persicaria]
MVKIAVLFSTLVLAVEALVQSPSYQFNVTSPAPNAPYVASQILPCIYDVADNSTSDNLQLSISLVGDNSSTVMTASADISKGFSFEKEITGGTVYEHQFNYHIPSNTTAGNYQVVFTDSVSQTNVSISITIAAAPVTSSSIPSSTLASATGSSTSLSPSSIINKANAATMGTQVSKYLVRASVALALVQFL